MTNLTRSPPDKSVDRAPATDATANGVLARALEIAAEAVDRGSEPQPGPCAAIYGVDFVVDGAGELFVSEVQAGPQLEFDPPDVGGQEATKDELARALLAYQAGRDGDPRLGIVFVGSCLFAPTKSAWVLIKNPRQTQAQLHRLTREPATAPKRYRILGRGSRPGRRRGVLSNT